MTTKKVHVEKMKGKSISHNRGQENILPNMQKETDCLYSDPINLGIMKDMELQLLDTCSYTDDEDELIALPPCKRKKIAQGKNDEKKHRKSSGKDSKNEFVLYRRQDIHPPLGTDYFSKMSDEIILHIFQWLPKPILVRCSSVCKRFRDLSYDETLWRRYDFGRKLIKPCVLEILLKRGVHILRLAMSDVKSPAFSDSFLSSQWHTNLRYLDLSMTSMPADDLSKLLLKCYHLKKLSLENCLVNDDACRGIAQNKNLTVLNMAMCSNFSNLGLIEISENCLKLVEWNLGWIHLKTYSLEVFLPTLPASLRRFNISGHRETLTDDCLIALVTRCPDLIELDVSDCTIITGRSFEVLVQCCQNLVHLHTSRCYSIPTTHNKLLKGLKNFKNLEIFRTLTDDAMKSVTEFMPELKINKTVFSTIARPTTGIRRTSIWGLRVRD